jgi:hypothetical protein
MFDAKTEKAILKKINKWINDKRKDRFLDREIYQEMDISWQLFKAIELGHLPKNQAKLESILDTCNIKIKIKVM